MALNKALSTKRSVENVASRYYWIFLLRKMVEQYFFRLLRSSIYATQQAQKDANITAQ